MNFSISQIFAFVMLILRLANWLTQKYSQNQWQAAQHDKDILEAMQGIQRNVTSAHISWTEAKALTPEELNRELARP